MVVGIKFKEALAVSAPIRLSRSPLSRCLYGLLTPSPPPYPGTSLKNGLNQTESHKNAELINARHPREGGDPVQPVTKPLDPRLRGDDGEGAIAVAENTLRVPGRKSAVLGAASVSPASGRATVFEIKSFQALVACG